MESKKYLITREDLDDCSLWYRNSHDDTCHKVLDINNLPEEIRPQDLIVRAKFATPKNKIFLGYLIGIKNIYAIAIFVNDKKYIFNKNLPQICMEHFDEISRITDIKYINDMFPICYMSDLDFEGVNVFSGGFDAFEKLRK